MEDEKFNHEVHDLRLATFFQQQLTNNPELAYAKQILKGQRLCGSQCSNNSNLKLVHVLSNGKESSFSNIISCHSVWACPRCSARVMAKKATTVACAIDALATWYKEYAVMITFTLPHTNNMSCKETFDILQDTWRLFTRGGNRAFSATKNYTIKSNRNIKGIQYTEGTQIKYTFGRNPYGAFRAELGCTRNVRVYEFTYGENGWHPHIHALFWIPKDNFDKVVNYEDELNKRWWQCAKICVKKHLPKEMADKLYPDWKSEVHKPITISKTANGKPRKQTSASYLAGYQWTSEKELCGSERLKSATEGHYTPTDLIALAYEHRSNPITMNHYLKLYTEYAVATFKHRRVQFSARSGINQIVNKWKQTSTYTEEFKKKFLDKEKGQPWKVVCSFDAESWLQIYSTEIHQKMNLRSKILQLAISSNARQQIYQLLKPLDIRLYNPNNAPIKQNNLRRLKELYNQEKLLFEQLYNRTA